MKPQSQGKNSAAPEQLQKAIQTYLLYVRNMLKTLRYYLDKVHEVATCYVDLREERNKTLTERNALVDRLVGNARLLDPPLNHKLASLTVPSYLAKI